MLILKIAAGVALGIPAAVLVIAFPAPFVALAVYAGVIAAVFAVLWLISLPLRPFIKLLDHAP